MSNPVIDRAGNKFWYNNDDYLHREDGPAVETANGDSYYYVNGQSLTKDKWKSHPLRIEYVIKKNLKKILK